MQIDTSPSTKIKVCFLKVDKIVGPDEISPSFFKGGGEVFTSEFTKLIRSF